MSLVEPTTISLLGMALDAAVMRHQAIAQNIANAGTPGYQRIAVSFESRMAELQGAIAQGQPLPSLGQFQPFFEAADNDAVSLDTEMAALSENTLHHQALLKALNKHMALMSLAINEGKR